MLFAARTDIPYSEGKNPQFVTFLSQNMKRQQQAIMHNTCVLNALALDGLKDSLNATQRMEV